MPIYVVATYDLTARGDTRESLPRFVRELQAEGGGLTITESPRCAPTALQQGMTVVMEFASKAEAGRWAEGMEEGTPVRRVWTHPIGEAPIVDEARLRSMFRSPRRRSRR